MLAAAECVSLHDLRSKVWVEVLNLATSALSSGVNINSPELGGEKL